MPARSAEVTGNFSSRALQSLFLLRRMKALGSLLAASPPLARDLVSLGEGNTPLVEVDAASLGLGRTKVLVKNRNAEPHGFLQRPLLGGQLCGGAKLGAGRVVCASTGNAAMAAGLLYANNLECLAVVPEATSITIVNAEGNGSPGQTWRLE